MISNITSSNHSDINDLPDRACYCILHAMFGTAKSTTSQTLVVIATIFIAISSPAVNIRWYKILQHEKRTTPISRKGNVAYPILTLYSVVQVFSIPLVIYHTVLQLGFIESSWHPPWLCYIGKTITFMFGSYVSFHSYFTAMVRYGFIIHESKVNNFGIQKTKAVFLYASVLVPVIIGLTFDVTSAPLFIKDTQPYRQCVEFSHNVSNMTIWHEKGFPDEAYTTIVYNHLTKVIPNWLVHGISGFCMIVWATGFSNLVEGYLYYRMFSHVKR